MNVVFNIGDVPSFSQALVNLSWAGFHPQGSDKRFQLTSCGLSSFSKLLGTIPGIRQADYRCGGGKAGVVGL